MPSHGATVSARESSVCAQRSRGRAKSGGAGPINLPRPPRLRDPSILAARYGLRPCDKQPTLDDIGWRAGALIYC
jgi:hypothetical protein